MRRLVSVNKTVGSEAGVMPVAVELIDSEGSR